ncbi:MAG TPA: phosphatase PAP2 family protein, partial [bacterium]|nr:phosphatase PAP2 family protein [bacterium]
GHGDTFPLLFAAAFVVSGSRRRLQDGALAVVLAGVVANVLKLLVMRERPTPGESFAWPSGHTSAATALAAAWTAWRPSVTVAGWTGAVGVGVSRVLRGRHWPSDVLSGLVLGTLCGGAVRRLPLFLPEWLERREVRVTIAWSAVGIWLASLLLAPSAREVELLITSVPATMCALWAAAEARGDPSRRIAGRWVPAAFLLLFVAVFALGSAGAGLLSLLDVDEPRFATASRTMLATGDWIVPYFNGAVRYDKPILIYWLQAAAMWLFGPSEMAARLPSALGVAVAAVACAGIGRLLGLALLPALLAGFAAGSAPLVQGLAHGATADALLYGITTALALVQVRRLQNGGSVRTWWLLWLGLGLAFLTKGPPALVGPIAVAIGLWWAGARPRWPAFVAGCLLASSVVLAWAVPALVRTHGGFWTEGIGHHVVARSVRPFEGHGGFAPWWLLTYLVTIPLTMLPWSLFLPWAIAALRGHMPGRDPRPAAAVDERATRRILLGWVAGVVGTFSLVVSKLPHYVLPCYPAIALAILLARPRAGSVLPITATLARGLGVLLLCALPVAFWTSGLEGAVAPGLLAGLGLCVTLCTVGHWLARGRIWPAIVALAAGLLVNMAALFGRGLPLANQDMIARAFQVDLPRHVRAGETVHLYHFVAPSVTFYLGRTVPKCRDEDDAARLLARPGELLLVRDQEVPHLVAAAERLATEDPRAGGAALRALATPLWRARGFHPTKGKVIEMRLYGRRAAAAAAVESGDPPDQPGLGKPPVPVHRAR